MNKIKFKHSKTKTANAKAAFASFQSDLKKLNKRDRILFILNFFVMGIYPLRHRQFVKGLLFLIIEIGYTAYMSMVGAWHLKGLVTLQLAGLRSNAVLVYGILSLFLNVFFLVAYIENLKAARKIIGLEAKGKPVGDYRGELTKLSTSRFYLISLIIPILGALLFTVIPLVFMVLIAFTDYGNSGTIPTDTTFLSWTGFDSFIQLFSAGKYFKTFYKVLGWTLVWALLATFTCYFGGFLLALLINKKTVKTKVLYRSLFVVAMAVPQFVTMRVMNVMFNKFGPINNLLLDWGIISEAYAFWDNITASRTLIILINMWVGIPYYMLLISGLLLNVPKDLYEAATIDGATKTQQFFRITFPHIFFMTTPLLITGFVSNINNFNVIWLLTRGEPLGLGTGGVAGGTDILITWLYKLTMEHYPEYNIGAAIGIIIFMITATVSLLIFRRSSSYAREDEFRL